MTPSLKTCIVAAAAFFSVYASFSSSASVVFSDDFESGSLSSAWSTSSSTANGRVGVSNTLGAPANSGSFHLAMDKTPAGSFNLNVAILTIDLSGLSNVMLSFFHKDVNDEDHPLPPTFVGSTNGDGVSLSDDGVNWVTLLSLSNSISPNQVYTQLTSDLSTVAANNGLTLGSNSQIKFQQFDNFPFNTDGRAFDDIVISANVPEPATIALFSLGLLGAGIARRGKSAA